MADFLGGLLSGGGGLYDDLLTPQQQSQLSGRGLLSLAGAFADAAMPSRFPVPLGAALGKAAAAMSGGRDEAALKLLQGQKLSQEVQTMKMTADLQKKFMEDLQSLPLSELVKRYGSGGAPAAAGPSVVPGAAPAAPPPTTAPLPPAALPDIGAAAAASAAGEYGGGQAPTGLLGPAPPLPPGDVPPAGPPMKASSLGGPDTVLPSGPGGLLATPATYGGGAGTPPFGPGGEAAPTVRLAASSGSPSDPRGLIPYIRERATALGIDPDVAVKVAQSEGLGTFRSSVVQRDGQREPSFGAFQLYTGGGMGNDFQRDTGLDPSDPKNERATIDYALNKAPSTGWTPWHGAAGAGIGPRTGLPGGPDYVVPSGRGVPANMLRQVADKGGAPGAPAAAGGEGMNTLLLELAKRNAMAEILKLGNPYGSMLSVLQGSPEYKGQIAGAEAKATQPFTQENATHASQLKILEDMAKDNMTVDKNGNIVLLPEAQRIRTMNAEQQAEAKAKWEAPQEQPVYSPDGTIKIEKMNTFEFRRRAEDKARRAALGDTMPRPGDLAQTPYYRPGQAEQETQAAQAKQQLAPNGILVNDGKGGTRRVQATVAQAAAAARGEPVPELGIKGLLQPGQASQEAALPAGTVASEPVYSETEKAIGTNAAKAFGEQRTAAQSAAEQIKINNESLRLLDSGLYTGWDANLALGMGRIFGIQGKNTAEKVQNTQLFVLQRMQQAADAVRAQPGSASDKDLAFMNRMSLGDITLEPSTIRQGMEIYNRFHLERIREHNRNAAGIAPGVTSGIRQTVDEPPTYRSGPAAPAIGTVRDGYSFKGGNPADPNSWQKAP